MDGIKTGNLRAILAGVLLLVLVFSAYLMIRRDVSEPFAPRPRIEVFKSARQLRYYDASGAVRERAVALGSNPGPPKEREGDGATPEGEYFVCAKNPQSKYFLSLGLSYPGPRDAERGRAAGIISEAERAEIGRAHAESRPPPWKTALGGEIFIHGGGTGTDWTQGCVALDNADMAELYALIEVGTPVIIRP